VNYFLYERITVRTPLRPAQIAERLARNVQPIRWFRSPNSEGPPFLGHFDPSAFDAIVISPLDEGTSGAFKIVHRSRYGSFAPVIEGRRLTSTPGETRVRLTFRLQLFTVVFFTVWTIGATWGKSASIRIGITAGMLGAFFVFFNLARASAKKVLLELLEGAEVE
jgi:hypothetical protein